MCQQIFNTVISFLVGLSPYISDPIAKQYLNEELFKDPAVMQSLKHAEKVWEFRSELSHSEFISSSSGGPRIHLRKYTASHQNQRKSAMLYLPGLNAAETKAAQFAHSMRQSLDDSDFFIADLRYQGLSRDGNTLDMLIDIQKFSEYADDYSDMIRYLLSQGYEKIVTVGHSTGAVGPAYQLNQSPDLFPAVKKVILIAPGLDTSPDILGKANNFGRVPISLISRMIEPVIKLRNLGSDLVVGYPKKPESIPGALARRNNSNVSSVWSSFFIKLMALSNPGDPFARPHTYGPTFNWVIASGKFSQEMSSASIRSRTPVEMYFSSGDYTVNPKIPRELCKRSPNCRYFTLSGLHDLPFEKPEITTLFRHEIAQALR